MILLEFPPGPPVREAPREHPGEACVLCLEGRLRLRHAGQEWILETGDTCHFDCRAPHTLENAGPGAARALLAMTPAAFGAFLPEPEAGVTAGSPGRSPATG
jgi:quercetin dioxygenase-like cupin family protein